jgi:hypothetical protein
MGKVKVGNTLNEPFQFSVGVKQRDGLSTTLFKIVFHSVINKTHQNGTPFLKSSHICAYADDLVIVTRDVNTLKPIYLDLEREIRSIGLDVNEKRPSIYDSINIRDKKQPTEVISGGEKL